MNSLNNANKEFFEVCNVRSYVANICTFNCSYKILAFSCKISVFFAFSVARFIALFLSLKVEDSFSIVVFSFTIFSTVFSLLILILPFKSVFLSIIDKTVIILSHDKRKSSRAEFELFKIVKWFSFFSSLSSTVIFLFAYFISFIAYSIIEKVSSEKLSLSSFSITNSCNGFTIVRTYGKILSFISLNELYKLFNELKSFNIKYSVLYCTTIHKYFSMKCIKSITIVNNFITFVST